MIDIFCERRLKKKPIFVIQKHDASTLHYDFRLEINGVLTSWAIPKGPSLSPKNKRLAIMTEDHPLSYANFEGVIPSGEYGAGPVLIWDRGTYKNIKQKNGKTIPMKKCLEEGHIEIELQGKKLQGSFAIVKFRGKKNWLLIKMQDTYANNQKNILKEDQSVKSHKTLKEIAQEK